MDVFDTSVTSDLQNQQDDSPAEPADGGGVFFLPFTVAAVLVCWPRLTLSENLSSRFSIYIYLIAVWLVAIAVLFAIRSVHRTAAAGAEHGRDGS